jgi:hypothetical protein
VREAKYEMENATIVAKCTANAPQKAQKAGSCIQVGPRRYHLGEWDGPVTTGTRRGKQPRQTGGVSPPVIAIRQGRTTKKSSTLCSAILTRYIKYAIIKYSNSG